jgi:hypothetical protein
VLMSCHCDCGATKTTSQRRWLVALSIAPA